MVPNRGGGHRGPPSALRQGPLGSAVAAAYGLPHSRSRTGPSDRAVRPCRSSPATPGISSSPARRLTAPILAERGTRPRARVAPSSLPRRPPPEPPPIHAHKGRCRPAVLRVPGCSPCSPVSPSIAGSQPRYPTPTPTTPARICQPRCLAPFRTPRPHKQTPSLWIRRPEAPRLSCARQPALQASPAASASRRPRVSAPAGRDPSGRISPGAGLPASPVAAPATAPPPPPKHLPHPPRVGGPRASTKDPSPIRRRLRAHPQRRRTGAAFRPRRPGETLAAGAPPGVARLRPTRAARRRSNSGRRAQPAPLAARLIAARGGGVLFERLRGRVEAVVPPRAVPLAVVPRVAAVPARVTTPASSARSERRRPGGGGGGSDGGGRVRDGRDGGATRREHRHWARQEATGGGHDGGCGRARLRLAGDRATSHQQATPCIGAAEGKGKGGGRERSGRHCHGVEKAARILAAPFLPDSDAGRGPRVMRELTCAPDRPGAAPWPSFAS